MSRLTGDVARSWIDRWDHQQERYLPDREERFTALIDAVEAGAGRPDPLVLDLGCGPGSLSGRLLDRLPGAAVVAVDSDPLLLALGRAHHADRDRLRFVDLDLRAPGWTAALGLARPLDAAVSTTALHWLEPDALRAVYAELHEALRPGGLLLNGDHLAEDAAASPELARLGKALVAREERRRFPAGLPEDWGQWWAAVTADPALADQVAERARRRDGDAHGSAESLRFDTHVTALRAAGFAEVGTLWQRGENRLLCAVRA